MPGIERFDEPADRAALSGGIPALDQDTQRGAEARVTEQARGLQAQLRQFPGQEKALIDYYRRNPDALASIRAPIFEEKVVDFLLELVKVTDKPLSREELMREEEDDKIV